jgi:hypothetical protein
MVAAVAVGGQAVHGTEPIDDHAAGVNTLPLCASARETSRDRFTSPSAGRPHVGAQLRPAEQRGHH